MQGILSSKTNLFAIIVLLAGVLVGVFLVSQSQEFRERAGKDDKTKLTICHKTGSSSSPWAQIEVDENTLKVHMDHGDILGDCPITSDNGQDDGGSGSVDNTVLDPNNNGSDTQVTNIVYDNSVTNNVTNVTNESNQNLPPTITRPQVNYSGLTKLVFYIKLQGTSVPDQTTDVSVALEKNPGEAYLKKDINIMSQKDGTFKGEIQSINEGQYIIFIKPKAHLQKKIGNVQIVRGLNTWYWTKDPFVAGDFDGDNDLDIRDVALLLGELSSKPTTPTIQNSYFDINFDTQVNRQDVDIVLSNYNELERLGEQ